ncbi:MAG: peptidase M49 [Planctomycetes bacterium]|nr:peptidase M49 [Planctomycetota bacterium]
MANGPLPSPVVAALAMTVLVSCSSSPSPASERKVLLERVDDTAIAQLWADGFAQLTPRDRALCYHLAQAAIAGRDIFLDQRFAYALEIRDVLEELFVHAAALEPAAAAELARYTKLFWVHGGIHHNLSTRKLPFHLSLDGFLAAAARARQDGAKLPDDARLRVLFDVMTNERTFESVTSKATDDGADPVRDSANNLYVGVTSADLERFEERHPLNSRVVKQADGTLVEEVYRMGDPSSGIPPGRYATEIARIVGHLRDALAVAPPATKIALEKLIRFYATGDFADWHAYGVAWVADTRSVVDNVNGFVEVYLDARGRKGAWEAVVSFVDVARTAAIERLAQQAQWFENRMPWDEEFKKPNVRGITARAISVVTETGDSGPITPIGINLPNEEDIRQQHGSKSVNLSNVVEAYAAISGATSVEEFGFDDAEKARARRWQGIDDVHTNLHEVVGHASGKVRKEVIDPARILGTYYSTLEEARADLVGLYWIADPKLVELGLVASEDAALAQYEQFTRNVLVQLRRVPRGGRIEEDHMRNRQLIVHWLIANTDAVTVVRRDGKTWYRVPDVARFRAGCGKLLAEVMRIKATGDFKAGKALVEGYGVKVDPTLHGEVLARLERLGLPSVTGFVMPELLPIRDASGAVVDAEIRHGMDLADQMLRWSGRR